MPLPKKKYPLCHHRHPLERQIDGIVYELYGLTEDEIEIVEEKI